MKTLENHFSINLPDLTARHKNALFWVVVLSVGGVLVIMAVIAVGTMRTEPPIGYINNTVTNTNVVAVIVTGVVMALVNVFLKKLDNIEELVKLAMDDMETHQKDILRHDYISVALKRYEESGESDEDSTPEAAAFNTAFNELRWAWEHLGKIHDVEADRIFSGPSPCLTETLKQGMALREKAGKDLITARKACDMAARAFIAADAAKAEPSVKQVVNNT